jgi:ABC-type transport system substrate-binding protein
VRSAGDQSRPTGSQPCIPQTPLGGGLWLSFNTQEKPFNNVLARQAVNLALNHQQLADSWAPGSTAMTEMFPTTSPYYNAADVNPPQNIAQAQTDFNKLATEGDPVDFTVTDLVGYEGIAQYVQSHLNRFKNVSVKISMVQGPTYESDSFKDNFQMIPQGFFFPAPWPTLAEGVVRGSSANYGQWDDPAVNAAVASLKLTTDPTKEKADWNIVLHEIQTQVPWFSSQAAYLTTAYAKNVHNVVAVENGVLPLMEQIHISFSTASSADCWLGYRSTRVMQIGQRRTDWLVRFRNRRSATERETGVRCYC